MSKHQDQASTDHAASHIRTPSNVQVASSLRTRQNLATNKTKKTEIISSIFSDHSPMKPEINYKKKFSKKKIRHSAKAKHCATKPPISHTVIKKKKLCDFVQAKRVSIFKMYLLR